jgi:flagellar export protein FliJ
MKFKFRLGGVLKIRKHEENQQQKVLAVELRKVLETEQNIRKTEQEMREFAETPLPERITGQEFNQRNSYLHGMHKEKLELETELKKRQLEAEKQRVKLVEFYRKSKSLENLEQRQKVHFVYEQNRLETLELSEIATIRFNRKGR